jgi:hypothetical protein
MNVHFVLNHEIIWVICITIPVAVPTFSCFFVKQHQFHSQASERGGVGVFMIDL